MIKHLEILKDIRRSNIRLKDLQDTKVEHVCSSFQGAV